MLHIDLKYIALLGTRLRNFRKKNQYLFNFSCPLCGDSNKKKNKARGYFYKSKGGMFFKCHNEGLGLSFGNFLKRVEPGLHEQYVFEMFGDKGKKKEDKSVLAPARPIKKLTLETLSSIEELPKEHYARVYVEARQIPKEELGRIFFSDDWSKTVGNLFPGRYDKLLENDPRLVLPFLDTDGNLVGLQGRSFNADRKLRYVTATITPESKIVFGAERVKFNQPVYVLEGPIDSLFIPNSIAVASSDLVSAEDRLGDISEAVYIFDNEPRNKEICDLLEEAIDIERKVCIWPETIREKDINDMILAGMSRQLVLNTIKNNTVSGIEAKMRFIQWKKC